MCNEIVFMNVIVWCVCVAYVGCTKRCSTGWPMGSTNMTLSLSALPATVPDSFSMCLCLLAAAVQHAHISES